MTHAFPARRPSHLLGRATTEPTLGVQHVPVQDPRGQGDVHPVRPEPDHLVLVTEPVVVAGQVRTIDHPRQHVPGSSTGARPLQQRLAEHTSELQSLMRTSYAAFCLKKHIYT